MNEILKNRILKTANIVGILLAVFLIAISVKAFKSISYVGRDVPTQNIITVNGKGEAVSIPDVATFSFSVTETAKTVDVAQIAATTKTNSAIKAMKDGGVEDKDIKTTSYNINPHYEYNQPNGKSILTGYDVSQTIQIKVRDLKKAGALFATIGSLGVQNVNGLSFSIDDIDTVKAKARDLAIKNAQEKAKTLARQLGVTIVRITSFYDSSDNQPYPYAVMDGVYNMKAESSMRVAPELPAGEQKVTSTVSITYEIR
jgi:uncharacterized protein YggE